MIKSIRKNDKDFLRKAKINKNDEFYTQMKDIERELQHYKNQFIDKVIYCNCDDPTISNFYKYFALNFHELGLKKLIASSYNGESSSGTYYIYNGLADETVIPTKDDLKHFDGNGDFRNQESIDLLKLADIVITNPPFSHFREFVKQLVDHQKQFLIIGNINAITYKEIFKLIQDNQVWLGINMGRGISGFIVPKHYGLYGSETKIDEHGNRIVSPNNCLWLTNLENYKRHEFLDLKNRYYGNESNFPKYDNFDGINVNRSTDIPYDFDGAIGVPITFLHKFNPDQFEIIKFRKGNDDKDLSIDGKYPYFRILIRHKKSLHQSISNSNEL